MTRRNDDNDDARDAHLLAALRHAPDRDALPPREVSERILAAARAAVRPAHEMRAPWWQRLGAWLTRPQVAAAFGTLAVASLVGVMWSTREPPVAEFGSNAPLADAAGRMDQRSMAPAPALSAPAEAAKPDAGGVAAPSAVSSEARDKIAVAPPPKKSGKDAGVRAESRARAVAETAPAAPAAATTTATPSAAPPPPPAAAPARQAADAAAPAAVAERRSANEGDLQVLARQQGAAAARSASAAAMGTSLAAKAEAVADPLARVDRLLTPWPEHMAWVAAGRQWAHGAPQAAWWSRLKKATAGAWQALPRSSSPSQPWLTLSGASVAVATIDFAGDSVVFCAAEGEVCWRAPITPAQRDAWIAEIARW